MAHRPPSYLVLDIETIPDRLLYSPPDPTPGNDRPAFPPLYACQPVVIGALWLDRRLRLRRLGTIGAGKDEAAMLRDLAHLMNARQPRLVTWNGRGFDLPVLTLRSLRHGLSWPWYFQPAGPRGRDRDYRDRYSDLGHLDLGDILAGRGAARMSSLDGAARLIGLPGKAGVDGSQVEGMYQAGDLESLRRYCLHDVVQTAFLFLRYRLLGGGLDLAGYRSAAGDLLAAVANDPRLARLVEAIDRDRLLLAAP